MSIKGTKPWNAQAGDLVWFRRFKDSETILEGKLVKRDGSHAEIVVNDPLFIGIAKVHVSLIEAIMQNHVEEADTNKLVTKFKAREKKERTPKKKLGRPQNNYAMLDELKSEIQSQEEWKNSPEGKATLERIRSSAEKRIVARKLREIKRGKKPGEKKKFRKGQKQK